MSAVMVAFSFTFVAVTVAALAPTPLHPTVSARPGSPEDVYVVQLAQSPVLSYDGGLDALAATRPHGDERVDPNSAAVTAYVRHLETSQRRVAAVVGALPIYHYRFSFNGFAVRVDEAGAARLGTMPGVLAVTKSEMLHLDTVTTPDFLGLSGSGGLWDDLGGTGVDGAGEGVVVGVIDSGVTPDAPSFSDPDPAGNPFSPAADWSGTCQTGPGFTPADCSDKLIGARYFNAGYGGDAAVLEDAPYELISPIDVDGHGTHVASTAVGNSGVPATVGGFDFGEMSGMAPRAQLAVYKVCWGRGNDGGCSTADAVAAIDQAVADGVDVINYSISGPQGSSVDPVALAFLSAAAAGVFVATSAGNNGDNDGAGSVAHNSPWVTTVAAGNHPRSTTATLTLGNGATFQGVSLATAAVGPVGLVSSVDVGSAGASAEDVRLCALDSLDPALVTGKMVLCQRGVVARVEKSAAVLQAGGVGMVLVNVVPGTLNADAHTVPSVHLSNEHFATLTGYIDHTVAPTASITAASVSNDSAGFLPAVADFSSLGPSTAHGGDVIKPDITAPGVDVVAAVSPLNGGASIGIESGTSMSSPHIAGLAALMIDLHPDWSPMMIKSALLTTAVPLVGSDEVHGELDPFDYGSGYVAPVSAADPGLVYDSTLNEWLGFLCGSALGPESCQNGGIPVIDPSDLNAPSVSIGSLANRQTITRRVTNVGAAATFNATVIAPAGTEVQVSPTTLSLGAGATGTFTVRFAVDSDEADYDQYTFGSLVWSDGSRSVRSPLAVRAVQVGTAVSVVAPTITDLCGTAADTITLPPVGGLSYSINGVASGPGTVAASGATTVEVMAADGFYLVGADDYQFEFTSVDCPLTIVPTPPGRFLDTRDSPTIDNTFTNVGRLGAGSVTRIKIAGRGSVADDAVGVVANLTAIGPAAPGFATLYPCTPTPPVASTANFLSGEVVANNTIVALDDAGEVCVFTLTSVDVALDVTGYVPNGSPLVGINPQRYLDTRPALNAPTFDSLSSAVGRATAGQTIEVQIAGRGSVPIGARSVVVNVTAIDPSAPGFVTVFSCGDRPTASTINYFAGQFVPNGAVSDLSDAGTLCVYTSAATDLAIDVSGWVPATDASSPSLTTATPARFLDTRTGPENPTVDGEFKGEGRLGGGQVVEVVIAGRHGVPSNATAAVVNIAVVVPDGPGFLTLYPCGDRPVTSSVNHTTAGTVRANNAIVKLSPTGTVCVFTLATTDVILDVTGWLTAS
jgi:subtilisin family serine protease